MEESTQTTQIACSLNGEEFRDRRSLVRSTLLPHLISIERLESGLKLSFPDRPPLRSDVETFVDLERQCCGFLSFAVTRIDAHLVVIIEGSADSQRMIDKFADFMTTEIRPHAG